MKILKNKDLMRVIINLLCLFIVILFYLISPLLKIVFNKWVIIISSIVILIILGLEFIFNNKEKIKKIIITINE